MKRQVNFFMRLGFILVFAFTLNPAFASKKSSQQSLDKIVAIVDNSVITQSELNTAIDTAKKQMEGENMPQPSAAALHKQVLDQLINRKLQIQYAEQANVHVTDADVSKAIEKIASQNQVSPDELYQKVTEQGMTRSDYRKEIHDEMVLQQVQQQEVSSKINVTPEEVKNFIRSKAWKKTATPTTENKVFHIEDILIDMPENASQQDIDTAKQTATTLLTDLQQKKPAPKEKTTDLGWLKIAEVPSAFSSTVVQMKNNEYSAPIQTANGFHILHLLGSREEGNTASAAPTEQEAQQMLFQKKFEIALKDWIAKLRSGASINLHPDN